jgi:periplasmic protein TonB
MRTGHYQRAFPGLVPVLMAGLLGACASGGGPSTTSGDTFQAFDQPPVLVHTASPAYPEQARKQKLEGTVTVRVMVNTDGLVEDAVVLRSSDPIFNEAAIEAAKQMLFRPGRLEGKAVRCAVAIPIQFVL